MRRLTIAALIVVVALAGLKYTLDLRSERSQAIAARNDAESMITFVLEHLPSRLEEVGHSDIFDEIGDKAVAYFSRLPERDLTDVATRLCHGDDERFAAFMAGYRAAAT